MDINIVNKRLLRDVFEDMKSLILYLSESSHMLCEEVVNKKGEYRPLSLSLETRLLKHKQLFIISKKYIDN